MADAQPTVEYRDIPGHPGFRACSDGTIWRQVHATVRKGYLTATLYEGCSRSIRLVHRLILMAFHGPCPDGMEGCHNDGDKFNNAPSNLRWDTRAENIADGHRHGVYVRGEDNHSKLKWMRPG